MVPSRSIACAALTSKFMITWLIFAGWPATVDTAAAMHGIDSTRARYAALQVAGDQGKLAAIARDVHDLCVRFPLYRSRLG